MSPFLRDAVERVAVSFVQGALAGLVATGASGAPMWIAAVTAGVTAAVSALKSVLAKGVGNSDSASLTKTV